MPETGIGLRECDAYLWDSGRAWVDIRHAARYLFVCRDVLNPNLLPVKNRGSQLNQGPVRVYNQRLRSLGKNYAIGVTAGRHYGDGEKNSLTPALLGERQVVWVCWNQDPLRAVSLCRKGAKSAR